MMLRFKLLAVLSLFCLLGGCKTTVYSNLSELEANEILVALANGGIHSYKTALDKGVFEIRVEESLLPRSVEILIAAGLPRSKFQTMGDIFKKESMVSTPLEEKARLIFALSQELASTIAVIDGVLDARVHLVLPETDNFGKQVSPSTASIFIKHRADIELSSQVAQIKYLAAGSIRDLKYEAISVYLFPAASSPLMPLVPKVTVFGLTVDPESETRIRILALATFIVIAASVWFGVRRLISLRSDKNQVQGG
jgi:type III secretion protein J